jgi:hypothetical protein
MKEHQRETDFLRHCLRYDESAESQRLQEGMTQFECDERCVRRALWCTVLSTSLAFAGLCYSTVFFSADSSTLSYVTANLVTKAFCVVGLGSLICMLAFCVIIGIYRHELDKRRKDCRRVALDFLESRLGKPRGARLPRLPKENDPISSPAKNLVSPLN